jgi:hypothetical protein
MNRTRLLIGLASVGVIVGVVLGVGAPRLTLLNAGLRIDYPAIQAVGRLLAGASLGLAAYAVARRWMMVLLALAALVAVGAGARRVADRMDAGSDDVALRGLFGTTRLPWATVTRVDTGPAVIVIWGPGDAQIRLETGAFKAEQRAVLERTISRRVRENTQGQ